MYMHTDNMLVSVVIVPLRIQQPSCDSLNSRRLRCCQLTNNNFLYVSSYNLPQHSLLRDLLTYKFFVQFWKAVKLKNNFNNISCCWFIGLKKQFTPEWQELHWNFRSEFLVFDERCVDTASTSTVLLQVLRGTIRSNLCFREVIYDIKDWSINTLGNLESRNESF